VVLSEKTEDGRKSSFIALGIVAIPDAFIRDEELWLSYGGAQSLELQRLLALLAANRMI
jgi:hypothetical protein